MKINTYELLIFFVNISCVVFIVVLLKYKVIGSLIVSLITIIIGSIYVVKNIYRMGFDRFIYLKGMPYKLLKLGVVYSLSMLILQLNYRIDILILEHYVSAAEIGLYAVGTNIAELVWQLPSAIGLVLFTKSASSSSNEEAVKRATGLLRMSIPIILVICLVIYFISPLFINYIFGEQYRSSVSVTRLLLPGVFMMVIFKILNADLAGRGYPLYALWVYIFPIIINIILNFLMIPYLGVSGAAISSSISYSIGALIFGIVYCKKEKIKYTSLIIKKQDILDMFNMKNNKGRV